MKKNIVVIFLLAITVIVTGCAGTSAVVKSEYRLAPDEKLELQLTTPETASELGVNILRERLTAQLSNNALLANAGDASSKIVEVTVTNYYMRHGAARAMVGVMAGADSIQSTVRIKDPTTSKVVSEFTVESSNPTALGTSKGLIEDHADKIVETLKQAKQKNA